MGKQSGLQKADISGKQAASGKTVIVGKLILWFAGTLGILILLMYLTACIPRTAFREHLLESARYLDEQEDNFYQLVQGDRRTEIHNYADAITLNIMYSIDGDGRLAEMLIAPFYSNQTDTDFPMIRLLRERIEEEKEADTIYDRYWHGMMVFLRPLFVVFNISQIRILFLLLMVVLMGWLTCMLWKRRQRAIAVSLWLAAFLVQFPMAAFCMEYLPVWLIMLVVTMAAVKWNSRPELILGLSVVSGVCCAFFDFLTTETIAIVLPLAVVVCLQAEEGRLKSFLDGMKLIISGCMAWGLAYVGTLVSKWTLSGLVLGQERFSAALQMVLHRQGAEVAGFAIDSLNNGVVSSQAMMTSGGEVLPQAVSAVMINLRLMFGLTGQVSLEGMCVGTLVVAGIAACFIYLYRKEGKACMVSGLLLILGMVPIVRMLVLNNHSLGHCFFVYRSLFVTMVCLITGFVKVTDWEFLLRKVRVKKGKKKK